MQRSLQETIDALTVAAEELRFHAGRLTEKTEKATADESEHLADMAKLYSNSARGCDVLRRYQEGRLKRGNVSDNGSAAIDDNARAVAHVEEG